MPGHIAIAAVVPGMAAALDPVPAERADPETSRLVRLARRDFVIRAYELRTKSAFNQAGLTLEALFPVRTDIVHNRTWHEWRQLIEAGFPFIKSDLFKKGKPHEFAGWEAVLSEQGYDPDMVRRALPGSTVAG